MSDVARSLHAIISALNEAKGAHPFARWEEILEAKQGTVEFSERHAAVVMLWRETVTSVRALPESSTRERRLSYANSWWHALVLPDRNWGEQKPKPFLDQASLDILDATAERLEEVDGMRSTQLVDSALVSLRSVADEWILRVSGDKTLPRSLRLALVERLESLIWFVDHAEQFGIASVVRSGETASGALLRAAVEYKRTTWLQRLGGLVGAITLVATGLGQVAVAVDYVQDIHQEIEAGLTGQPDPDSQGDAPDGEAKQH